MRRRDAKSKEEERYKHLNAEFHGILKEVYIQVNAGVQLQQPGIQPEEMNGVGERNEAASHFSWTASLFQV